jgi:hypothetical protein
MYEYRFRAECRVDVEVLMSILPDAIYEIRRLDNLLPDVEVDMLTVLDFAAVKAVISQIPDSQVITRTIAKREDYKDSFHRNRDAGFSDN